MSYMKIAVGLRRETGTAMIIDPLGKIFVDLLFYKMF